MLAKPLARRVDTAARRFYQRELWTRFTDEHLLAIEIPDEALPIYAILLGAGGQEFGVSIYLGERALEQVHHITRGPRPPFIAPILLLSFDPIGAVAPEYRELARIAGSSGRVIPTARSIAVGGKSRPAANEELRLIAQVVEAVLMADDNDLLRPRRIDLRQGGKLLTLAVAGAASKVQGVTARFCSIGPVPGLTPLASRLPTRLTELPLLDAHWVIGFEPSPLEIADESNRPWLLLVVDPEGDRIVDMQVVPLHEPDDLDEAVHTLARILAAPKHTDPGLPRRLTIVHERLAGALADLSEQGATIDIVKEHPSVTKVIGGLRERLGSATDDDATLPDAADRQRWLAHDQRLHARIVAELERVDLDSHKALAAFFGDHAVYEELEDMGLTLHRVAYREWYVTSFRGKAGRRTIAERILAGPLPAAERCLLLARVAARTGLWVVAARTPPMVVLRDIFSDEEFDIQDGALAAKSIDGYALPARIANANGHRFVIPLGPDVPPLMQDSALADLQQSFGSFPSADLQRRPEMLGTLWEWLLDEAVSASAKRLTNTDGDTLEPLVGTFHVTDWPRFLAVVEARGDVVRESDDCWTWLRLGDDNTVLASLERVFDELLVEVNSQQRLTSARAWLEAIPGVVFTAARVHEHGEHSTRSKSRGIDPALLHPEDLTQLQAHIDTQTMRWLDERIPALGNRTPREAVHTRDGRELVLRLIRSWPDPGGIPGLRTPRERLRRELGLSGPDAQEDAAP